MDKEARGFIEEELDRLISETDTVDVIRWVTRETPVRSQEDFALGYLIGSLTRYAFDVAWKKKGLKKVAEKWEREMGKERYREYQRRMEDENRDYKPFKFRWTKKDETQVRNMLKRRLVDMKRKVYRDFNR